MMHEVAGAVADAGRGDAEQFAEGIAGHGRVRRCGRRLAVCVYHSPDRPPAKVRAAIHGGSEACERRCFARKLLVLAPALGQNREPPPPPRYGIDADLDALPARLAQGRPGVRPQGDRRRRFDYVVAQLADPDFVDKQVAGRRRQVRWVRRPMTDRLTDDPEPSGNCGGSRRKANSNVTGDAAIVSHKDVKGRQVYLRKIGSRWFLEDRQKAGRNQTMTTPSSICAATPSPSRRPA